MGGPFDRLEVWAKELGSWHPDLSYGTDFTIIGPYEVGSSPELAVYPDGRDGAEASVRLVLTGDLISLSDRDAVHVEVHKNQINIWGSAIEGFEEVFPR